LSVIATKSFCRYRAGFIQNFKRRFRPAWRILNCKAIQDFRSSQRIEGKGLFSRERREKDFSKDLAEKAIKA
jgi:hypothetical protein